MEEKIKKKVLTTYKREGHTVKRSMYIDKEASIFI